MAKQKRKQRKKKNNWQQRLKFEIAGLLLFALSIISLADLGFVGGTIISLFRFFTGEWFIVCILALAIFSLYIFWNKSLPMLFTRKLVGIYFIFGSILLLSHIKLFYNLSKGGTFASPSVILNTWELFFMELRGEISSPDLGGGMVGAILFACFYYLFAAEGARIVAYCFIMIGMILFTGKSLGVVMENIFSPMFKFLTKQFFAFVEDMKHLPASIKRGSIQKKKRKSIQKQFDDKNEKEVVEEEEPTIQPIISSFTDRSQEETVSSKEANQEKDSQQNQEKTDDESVGAINIVEKENKDYQLPPIELLSLPKYSGQHTDKQNIYENARKLEKTFQSFGVKAKVTQVHLGPAVTKYEVYPDVGVKVSKIVNLSDDLALALAAKDIRIEAPIPGKSAVGIEVPNSEVAMVSLREVLESKANDKPNSKLLIGLGRDITGEAVLAELNKMPHLLVAGATGSGKSVCINGIITSILMRAKPHEVKMMMIDPKMVELNVYNGIPHLLTPVVTDPKKASQALKKVVNEMERRYELFSHTGTRNIEGYNEWIRRQNAEQQEKQLELPYIVVIVDELADLMMVASTDVEDCITRLAQMARAAGIHLIIATQRPSVDVITGVIKANIPSRIAFSVSSQTDSRTILDMGGAEKLLGRGDMLFLPVGASKPIRVQGAFLSDEEVEKVVDYVISQQKAQYQEEMIPNDPVDVEKEVADELYDEAVQLVIEMQSASVSMLQRRFRIGYTRAARLIDAMEERGVVGPYEGSKPRQVLLTKEQYEQLSS
ncbi:FtsK/SpoIIIE family DNA translocase [Bacillus alveayuensis]|uniref:FtsK/SpoIIIE family DNA translocase n=1 Tax=Aeribacillus alveayuensis TaxID=279215 RepID=UPI0005CD50FA|nr:DNA translocase FtsK [Bacillus alveayuensis]